jgi:hypothetical protein
VRAESAARGAPEKPVNEIQQALMSPGELMSRLGVLLGHLLKWELQPDRRSRSWFCGIREQRRAINRLLSQNPSLRAKAEAALTDALRRAWIWCCARRSCHCALCLPSPPGLEQALDPAVLCDTRGDWGGVSRLLLVGNSRGGSRLSIL